MRLYKERDMANGKFSAQVSTTQSGIPSRTERRKEEAFRRRDTLEERKFNQLQAQAQQLQQTEFSNITSVEQYRQKYSALSPELQQFFLSPADVEKRSAEFKDPVLVQRSSNLQFKIDQLKAQLDDYNKEIQESQKRYYSAPQGKQGSDIRDREDATQRNLRKILTPVANEYDELKRQQNIIEDSKSEDEATQRLQLYQRQSTASLIQDQERQKSSEINRILKEAEQRGYGFVKVEESDKGKPTSRKVYVVTPEGEYKLVSTTKAQDVSRLKQSAIEKATVTDVIRIGGKDITFTGVQDLFKTPQGKLATAYGSFDITEDEAIRQQEEERRKAAEQFVSEKAFSPVITEPTKKLGVLGSLLAFYRSTQFGVFSPIEREGDVKRQWLSITGTSFPKLSVLSLDTKTASELTQGTSKETNIAQQQASLVGDLGKLIEESPEELKYDVQQIGLEKLKALGINYVVDESTGELIFTSKEITPRMSFAGSEFLKAERKGQSTIPLYLTFGGLKALEFFAGGEVIGSAFKVGKAGVNVIRTGVGLERGLKLTEVTIRGGRVIGTAEYVEQSALKETLGKIIGKVGKTARTGVLVGIGGIYGIGKVSQYGSYRDIYGDKVGRELFILETSGEIAGIGLSLGKAALQNREIAKLNERIGLKNYEREIKFQRLQNIKLFGQFSTKARVTSTEFGAGKTVLSKSEKEIIKGVFVKQAGFTEAEAEKFILEGAAYKQDLIVESPAGFEAVTFSRKGLLKSVRRETGFEEVGLDFTTRGRRVSNIVLKTTTGEGKFALTSVFEKTRRSRGSRELLKFGDLNFIGETVPQDKLRLKDVLISKIGKRKELKIGEVSLSAAKIENRLMKSFPKSKDRYTVLEALESKNAKYSEKDLLNFFERAGVSSRTSPYTQRVVRIDVPNYRKEGILRIREDDAFLFKATGKSGRQLSMKNIMKDLDFKELEQALRTRKPRRTPFSKIFTETTPETNIVREVERQLQTQTKQIVKEQQVTTGLSISPSVSEFKISTRIKGATRLKELEGISGRTSISVKEALRELLGERVVSQVRQKSLIKEKTLQALRVRQAQAEVLKQQPKQRQQQRQSTRLSQPEVTIPRSVSLPLIAFDTFTPNLRPPRINLGLPKSEKKLKNILNLKKLLREQELAYLPSFTAKALGLDPIEVKSEAEAIKVIKQMRSGLDIRLGVKIRK